MNMKKMAVVLMTAAFMGQSAYADVLPVPAMCPSLSNSQAKDLINEGKIYLNMGGVTNPGNKNNATMSTSGSYEKYGVFKSPKSVVNSAPMNASASGIECKYMIDGREVSAMLNLDPVNTFAVAAAPAPAPAPTPSPAPVVPEPVVAPAPVAPAPVAPAPAPGPEVAAAPEVAPVVEAASPKAVEVGDDLDRLVKVLVDGKDPKIVENFKVIHASVVVAIENSKAIKQCANIADMCQRNVFQGIPEKISNNCEAGGKNFDTCKKVQDNLQMIKGELGVFESTGALGSATLKSGFKLGILKENKETPEPDDVVIQKDQGF